MALPTLDATFASSADLPRRQMLAKWLVEDLGSGSIADYYDLPERYLWAKIAVAAGAPLLEADYISLPKQYVWKAIYDAVSGSSLGTIDWVEKQALGHIAAAYRGDTANPENLATYIDWPWRYQVASIVIHPRIDADALAFAAASGATDLSGLSAFVKGVKELGLWSNMVCWPLRSSQNAGTGTTAYSLGGLGTYNGTLTNGPTWGADGIAMVASPAQNITISPVPPAGTSITASAVHKTALNVNARVISFNGTNGGLWSPFNNGDGYWDAYNNITHRTNASLIGVVSANTMFMHTGAATPTNLSHHVNGGVALSSLIHSTALGALGAMAIAQAGSYTGTAAFILYSTNAIDQSQLYSLYRDTLGTGLGLP